MNKPLEQGSRIRRIVEEDKKKRLTGLREIIATGITYRYNNIIQTGNNGI
jgi:hypothetical protein